MSPNFPLELHDEIIALLRDDHTLKSCALVCKTFLHMARRRLFYNVSVSKDKMSHFNEVIGENPRLRLYFKSRGKWMGVT